MVIFLSLVTSVKDYIEVLHKFIETDSMNSLNSYYDFGTGTTFVVLAAKEFLANLISLKWLQTIWSIPTLIPDVASAMVSEISLFNGTLQNSFTLLEQPISYGNQNLFFYCLEKFTIGVINSLFLFLPTSTAHLITLRRFVMQGLEAGYIAGLGTIAGNIIWIGSIIFGLRFLVIPWLSFDILRYILGFLLLVKYMWDSFSERRSTLDDLSKSKIFLLNFLLAFTEQTNLFPFLSNLSIGSDSTLLESFPTLSSNGSEFFIIHGFYLIGILVGSLSLLQLSCWFWENPAYNFYIWIISSFKVTTTFYYKFLNFFFLYLTMICAISNVSYFGLDYTITNPLGFSHEDRLIEQKVQLETSFLNSKASDRNTRRNRGRHGRRERWKRRVRRYRTFDASLYDQGVYDLFTIEDLNYGFDRFWLRRKIRNHRVRFRFFPGPWMRSFKKQLTRPRLESFMGPRIEFFRILFEQAYHPEFHEFKKKNLDNTLKKRNKDSQNDKMMPFKMENFKQNQRNISIYFNQKTKEQKENLIAQNSALRKFLRKTENRVKLSKIQQQLNISSFSPKSQSSLLLDKEFGKPISSKKWKSLFSKVSHDIKKSAIKSEETLLEQFSNKILFQTNKSFPELTNSNSNKGDIQTRLTKADQQVLRYKSFLKNKNSPFVSSADRAAAGGFWASGWLGFTQKPRSPTNSEATTGFWRSHTGDFVPDRYSTQEEAINLSNKNSKEAQTKKNSLITLSELTLSNNLTNQNSFNSSERVDSQKYLGNENRSEKEIANNKVINISTKEISKMDFYKPMTLLHPLKYYLQEEKALKKKFDFYGVKQYRNFGIEKNAPYFRVMMKRFFSYYKPTLRWERTMRVATMRKARRKGARIPRKLKMNNETKALAIASSKKENFSLPNKLQIDSSKIEEKDLSYKTKIQNPTHFYSLVSKRASRYRYEIYKDVLQHWYYSPFNRLLLKFDIDSFIRRQPKNHFLTKKDETDLHLKRYLMSEYYNSLRWYTYMQHYDSMKSKIGQTKTLTSRVYNQQFHGTLKKIRHLFAITPLSEEQAILKFDQPLFNEFPNNKNQSILNDSVFHEEILADDDFEWMHSFFNESNKNYNKPSDLKNQSTQILREYLKIATPIRQELIKQLLIEKNYAELTKFLFRGQKLRGTSPITNEKSYLQQEGDALLNQTSLTLDFNNPNFQQKLWFELIKKCHNKLYDQKALKNYVLARVDKHEKQKQKKQKNFKMRMERIKTWYISPSILKSIQPCLKNEGVLNNCTKMQSEVALNKKIGFSSSIQKAMKEAYDVLLKNKKTKQNKLYKFKKDSRMQLKIYLENRLKQSKIEALQFEKNFKKIYSSQNSLNQINQTKNSNSFNKITNFILHNALKPFEFLKAKGSNIKKAFGQNAFSKTLKNQLGFTLKKGKDLDQWRKTENVLSKRKKIRKTLKRLRNTKKASSIDVWNLKDLKAEKFGWTVSKTGSAKQRVENRKKKDFEELLGATSSYKKATSYKKAEAFKKASGLLLPTTATVSLSEPEMQFTEILKNRREKTWRNYTGESFLSFENLFWPFSTTDSDKQKKFKKRRSRMRRYRFLKGRGPIKKRTLGEKLKGQFRFLKKYGAGSSVDTNDADKLQKIQNKKRLIFQTIMQNQKIGRIESKDSFEIRDIKQRRTRVRKHRYWKKHKKQKDAQNRRKIKKRRRYGKAKIRGLNKKLKKMQSNMEVKKWWWQEFLPNFQKDTYLIWQTQKNLQIKDQLSEFSASEILKRDQFNEQNLQIGEKDFKPLAIPEAIRIREKLRQNNQLDFFYYDNLQNEKINLSKKEIETLKEIDTRNKEQNEEKTNSINLLNQISQNLFYSSEINTSSEKLNDKNLLATNPIPFYAGWDESARKFVVTNRLLSRKDAGYSFFNQQNDKKDFLKAPLRGMNAPTTLYWQVPFTTYDPDQFFALGMDGFSPIGWRNFHFKSSKQTTKPILVKKIQSTLLSSSNKFSEDLRLKFMNKNLKANLTSSVAKELTFGVASEKRQNQTNLDNRIQKRYKRVKKHPRPPVWFPSGSLANQVLPVHYIYVFYKRSRLPRDRYVRRRLRRTFNNESVDKLTRDPNLFSQNQWIDYTLRKRAKPKRKYHRKGLRMVRKNEEFLYHLKRRKFRGFADENERFRPLLKENQKAKEQKTFGKKQRRTKMAAERSNKKQKSNRENLRLRQLRRRVQRQVFRPVWRYKPQAGGVVWPGDYLRLELVKAPKLQTNLFIKKDNSSTNLKVTEKQRKIRKKKQFKKIQEWQVQPKKYLLQKHNLKALKKRFQKSQNFTSF